jgi:hypothetical protein
MIKGGGFAAPILSSDFPLSNIVHQAQISIVHGKPQIPFILKMF